MSTMVEEYTKTYTAFSGCDITACFNGKVIGEIQGLSYSVNREKSPIYTMGSAEPRSFARGKRGIAGNLVFTMFDRDALLDAFKGKLNGERLGIQKFKAEGSREYLSVEDWDAQMSAYASPNADVTATGETGGKVSDLVGKYAPVYADEILPFDISITFANEYGQKAVLVIYGVELLNEGSGFSIDNVQSEKAYTFVARRVEPMKSLNGDADANITASW